MPDAGLVQRTSPRAEGDVQPTGSPRRVWQYLREVLEGARTWVFTGQVADVGRTMKVVVAVTPIAWPSSELVAQARRRYHANMDVGRSLR